MYALKKTPTSRYTLNTIHTLNIKLYATTYIPHSMIYTLHIKFLTNSTEHTFSEYTVQTMHTQLTCVRLKNNFEAITDKCAQAQANANVVCSV